jgi:ubiquinone/menaquinone biosynthesis C-methylase UbiE
VGQFAPFESILEVGCGAGANLVVLARGHPGTRLYGVDISPRAIRAAERALSREAIADATVLKGRADDLSSFSDKSVDIVLTDAVLMYIGPDRIGRVVSELARVARKRLILNEWHWFEGSAAGSEAYWHCAHWVHDYVRLLGSTPEVKAFRVERLPPGMWSPGGGWEAYGALVEVEL